MLNDDNKRTWLWGLLLGCPMRMSLDTCPVQKYRTLPIKQRLQFVNAMDYEEMSYLIGNHEKCLRERDGRT